MKEITTRAQLVELARQLGLRPDWHEPDEQGVTARVEGNNFDNAMSPGEWYAPGHAELHAIISAYDPDDDEDTTEPKEVAVINLATLFAWACGLEG